MKLAVHSLFYTLQGEGANVGRVAVFVRLSGCNLWSGREQDRATAHGSCGRWCDTEFAQPLYGLLTPRQLVDSVNALWPCRGVPFAVFTGGEPLLQLKPELVLELRALGLRDIAIETNGTIAVPPGIDWVCVSPKAGQRLLAKRGDELKLVWPQSINPASLSALDFRHFWLSPMAGPDSQRNTADAISYCLENPRWRLSVQMHKTVGLP